MSPSRADHKILIIAPDPLLAALVGVLVETARFQAAFPSTGERAEDALKRVRPLAAILMDTKVDEAASDIFLARARRRQVPVLLFGSERNVEAVRARHHGQEVPTFALPRQTDQFRTAIERLAHKPAVRRGDRRKDLPPHIERNQSGDLVLDDGKGGRWTVYDRRTGDRRTPRVEREFVNEAGEVRRCTLSVVEATSLAPEDLSRQLSSASAD